MKVFIVSLLVVMISVSFLYAEEQTASVDWNKIDNRLFRELKKEYSLSDAQTYELLGRTYLQQNEWKRGSIYFNKAVQLNPKLYLSWYNLGLINMDNPEFFFKKAIGANSAFAPAYYWLAYYYYNSGKMEGSELYFEKYLKVADKNDPQEQSRIKEAQNMILKIRGGNEG